MEFEKCEPNGHLISSDLKYIFNEYIGTLTLYNLSITKKGMYLISISISTNHSQFQNFNCSSKTVLVNKRNMTDLPNQRNDSNIFLTFDEKLTLLNQQSLNTFKCLIYNCLILKNDLDLKSEINFRNDERQFFLTAHGFESNFFRLFSSLQNFSLSNDSILKSANINQKQVVFDNLQLATNITKTADSQNNDMVLK